ncbi:MAG: DegT/DnrJ/EryC1/StrS family aminotransferase [Pseudomonadota bacterium]
MATANFLPEQYRNTGELAINHNYLPQQFAEHAEIFRKIEELLKNSDFTLGEEVDMFEANFAATQNAQFAIGVGSGTDALFLSLKALGVGPGDEVITTPYTFYATIGAIVTAGATPVFVDVKDDYNIDPSKIESAINSRTKAILPVHWSGLTCDMDAICEIAANNGLAIVEDACHAIKAHSNGQSAGTFGNTGCFSMHPLKNLNVWGDGGVVVTSDAELRDKLSLMRNHGLINRDETAMFAYNSRLDTIQAIVANELLKKIDDITEARIDNASFFDSTLADIPQISVPLRDPSKKQVFHIYCILAERRGELQAYLIEQGIDAKIHYPIPMHLQPAAREFGYKPGDFPKAEAICDNVISLPVHEFITSEQREFVASHVRRFYS